MIVKLLKSGKVESESKPLLFTFPDGQPHLTFKLHRGDYDLAQIHCSLRGPDDLFNLFLAHQVVKRFYPTQIYIYWCFGARMDRAIDENQPATFDAVVALLSSFCTQPNWFFLDIHNPKVVPYAQKISLTPIVEKVLANFGPCDIFFPDAGAAERYKSLFPKHNILTGKKKRDSQTGKLSGFELDSGVRVSDSALIFDDICDGGYTFLGQSNVLNDLGYKKLGLYTTHGLYTKGVQLLAEIFDNIYCTNSFEFGTPIEEGYPTNTRLMLKTWNETKFDYEPIQ